MKKGPFEMIPPGYNSRRDHWGAAMTANCVWVVYAYKKRRKNGIDYKTIERLHSVWLLESEAKAAVEHEGKGFTYYGICLWGTGAEALRAGITLLWESDLVASLLAGDGQIAERGFHLYGGPREASAFPTMTHPEAPIRLEPDAGAEPLGFDITQAQQERMSWAEIEVKFEERCVTGLWPSDTCEACQALRRPCCTERHHHGQCCLHCGNDERHGNRWFFRKSAKERALLKATTGPYGGPL